LTKRRLKRGVCSGIGALQAGINRFVAEHNQNPVPFVWTADQQRAVDDVVRARIDLDHGRRRGALNRTEQAETVRLNARQDGTYDAADALKSLESADALLRQAKVDTKNASQTLRTAEAGLATPGTGENAGAIAP
jgi:hypothetical protein